MKIMLPLDGSELSESVLPWVVGLARRLQAELLLVKITDPFVAMTPEMPSLALRWQEQAEAESARYLERLAASLCDLKVETRSMLGVPRDVLPELATTSGCQLIAMASHGRTGVARWLLGSVAERVLRRATCPVLLMRPGVELPQQGFRRVLVPVDGSATSERVLQEILPYLAEEPQVVVMRASGLTLQEHAQVLDPGARESYLLGLEASLADLKVEGLQLDIRVVDSEAPEAILTLSEEMNCDLIAMSTHGRTGLDRFLLGSVTEKVARYSKMAVLAFPVSR